MQGIIDTHAHLDEIEDSGAVLDDSLKAGITGIVAMGSNSESNSKVMELQRKYPAHVYPALGLHPCELGNINPADIDITICSIVDNASAIVAIGEIGLDYDKRILKAASKELQKSILNRLLEIAVQYKKPISVHSRYAWRDCYELVKGTGIEQAVFHWFTGPYSILKEILDAGYFISCTPAAEYHEEHRNAVKQTPVGQLLVETDCPVVYGREIRYRSCPADIIRSLRYAAELKGMDNKEITESTTKNAEMLFGITASGNS